MSTSSLQIFSPFDTPESRVAKAASYLGEPLTSIHFMDSKAALSFFSSNFREEDVIKDVVISSTITSRVFIPEGGVLPEETATSSKLFDPRSSAIGGEEYSFFGSEAVIANALNNIYFIPSSRPFQDSQLSEVSKRIFNEVFIPLRRHGIVDNRYEDFVMFSAAIYNNHLTTIEEENASDSETMRRLGLVYKFASSLAEVVKPLTTMMTSISIPTAEQQQTMPLPPFILAKSYSSPMAFDLVFKDWIETRTSQVKEAKVEATKAKTRENDILTATPSPFSQPTIVSASREIVFKVKNSLLTSSDIFARAFTTEDVPFIQYSESPFLIASRESFEPTPEFFYSYFTDAFASEAEGRTVTGRGLLPENIRSRVGRRPKHFFKVHSTLTPESVPPPSVISNARIGSFVLVVNATTKTTASPSSVSEYVTAFLTPSFENPEIFTLSFYSDISDEDIEKIISPRIATVFSESLGLFASSQTKLLRGHFTLFGKDAESFSPFVFYFLTVTHPAIRPFIYINETLSTFSEKVFIPNYHLGSASSSSSSSILSLASSEDNDRLLSKATFKIELDTYTPPPHRRQQPPTAASASTSAAAAAASTKTPASLRIGFKTKSEYDLAMLLFTLSHIFGLMNETLIPASLPFLTSSIPGCCGSIDEMVRAAPDMTTSSLEEQQQQGPLPLKKKRGRPTAAAAAASAVAASSSLDSQTPLLQVQQATEQPKTPSSRKTMTSTTTRKTATAMTMTASQAASIVGSTAESKIDDLRISTVKGTIGETYITDCQCIRQPVVISPDEVPAWSPFRTVKMFAGRNYVCPSDQHPIPGYTLPPSAKQGAKPYPCCFKTEKQASTGLARVTAAAASAATTMTAEEEATLGGGGGGPDSAAVSASVVASAAGVKLRADYIISRLIKVPTGRIGLIPNSLSRLLKATTSPNEDFVRVGTPTETPNSILHAVLIALDDEEYRNAPTTADRERLVISERERLVNKTIATNGVLFAQEFFDENPNGVKSRASNLSKSVLESLKDGKELDSKVHIRGVEDLYSDGDFPLHIFVLVPDDAFPGSFKFEIPRHALCHLPPPPKKNSKIVLLAKIKEEGDNIYHYEPIISRGKIVVPSRKGKLAKVSGEPILSFDSTTITGKLLYDSFCQSCESIIIERDGGKEVAQFNVGYENHQDGASLYEVLTSATGQIFKTKMKPLKQYIDLYGKTRSLTLVIASKSTSEEDGDEPIITVEINPPCAPFRDANIKIDEEETTPLSSYSSFTLTKRKFYFSDDLLDEIVPLDDNSKVVELSRRKFSGRTLRFMIKPSSFTKRSGSSSSLTSSSASASASLPFRNYVTKMKYVSLLIQFIYWARICYRVATSSSASTTEGKQQQTLEEWWETYTKVDPSLNDLEIEKLYPSPQTLFSKFPKPPLSTPTMIVSSLYSIWPQIIAFNALSNESKILFHSETFSRKLFAFISRIESETFGVENELVDPTNAIPKYILGILFDKRDFCANTLNIESTKVLSSSEGLYNWIDYTRHLHSTRIKNNNVLTKYSERMTPYRLYTKGYEEAFPVTVSENTIGFVKNNYIPNFEYAVLNFGNNAAASDILKYPLYRISKSRSLVIESIITDSNVDEEDVGVSSSPSSGRAGGGGAAAAAGAASSSETQQYSFGIVKYDDGIVSGCMGAFASLKLINGVVVV